MTEGRGPAEFQQGPEAFDGNADGNVNGCGRWVVSVVVLASARVAQGVDDVALGSESYVGVDAGSHADMGAIEQARADGAYRQLPAPDPASAPLGPYAAAHLIRPPTPLAWPTPPHCAV
ncbi:hypothetical protein GCM10010300_81070 [Streptomyces olivaceoviridis]|nr:hypothetical protein GCM10010300_81070 [Streptomyces olivaceoviridis]